MLLCKIGHTLGTFCRVYSRSGIAIYQKNSLNCNIFFFREKKRDFIILRQYNCLHEKYIKVAFVATVYDIEHDLETDSPKTNYIRQMA